MDMEIYFDGNKKVNARYKDLVIKTDQSVKNGGEGTAPAPFDLFLASLGTCAGIYVKRFCDERNIATDKIKLIQKMEYDMTSKMISKISIEIQLPADFPEKYKSAVISAANLCAVKKHLQNPPQFEVYTGLSNQ